MKRLALSALLLLSVVPFSPALAVDWVVTGHVTMVETTYVPSVVVFTIDVPGGNCSTGAALSMNASGSTSDQQIANIQGNLSAILSAFTAGRNLLVGGNNSGCTVSYIQIRP